jgi:hypothetical protein
MHPVEVKARHLGVEVLNGMRFIRRRDRHRDRQGLTQLSESEDTDQATPLDRLRILGPCAGTLETVVGNGLRLAVVQRMPGERRGKTHRKIELPARSPAACDAHTRNHCATSTVTNTNARPQNLAGIVVDGRAHIEQYMRRLACWIGKAADPGAQGRRQLGMHTRVFKIDRVVAGMGLLTAVRKARAIARVRDCRVAWLELNRRIKWAGERLDQKIAQVRVARARKMRCRETEDGRVLISVAGGPFVTVIERTNLRIGAQLHHAERNNRPGECMPLGTSPNHGVYGLVGLLRLQQPCEAYGAHGAEE